ncbi:BQ5605_C002g01427 [Microbotryum silenes-dioicae]|uniref:BQ5605_C002g01427 protein n=1 Tax=Microbotryum silenes-dioicae TaxID=796604 RepID=A0A2X0MTH5_9BASI|nr:BQ5605_C002g01427 [Microbotryum silenes-dioicae]
MASMHSSSSRPSVPFASYGIRNIGMVLLREPFEVPHARRVHAKLVDEQTGRAIYFTQHRTTVYEAALFMGREKINLDAVHGPGSFHRIGQCSEEDLEFRDITVSSQKLYKSGFFSNKTRSWKAPDGLKYSWLTGEDGSLRLTQNKTHSAVVSATDVGNGCTRIVISTQVIGFVELVLLTMLQQEFELSKAHKKLLKEAEDQDGDLCVW